MVAVVTNIITFITGINKMSYKLLGRPFSYLPSDSSSYFPNCSMDHCILLFWFTLPKKPKTSQSFLSFLFKDWWKSHLCKNYTQIYSTPPICFHNSPPSRFICQSSSLCFHIQAFGKDLIPILPPSSYVANLGQITENHSRSQSP